MRRTALIAITIMLLACGGIFSAVQAQSLSNAGGDSSDSSGGGGSSSGGSSGSGSDSNMTATPGSGLPSGTSTNLVPVPSHPSGDDSVPDTTQSSSGHSTKSHPSTTTGGNGESNSSKKSGGSSSSSSNQDTGLSSMMGTAGDEAPKYDENGEPYRHNYFQATPINLQLSLRRVPGLNPSQFQLHIAAHFQITSCIKFSKIPNTVSFNEDGTVKIEIKKFTVDARDISDAGTACQPKTGEPPAADIVLDRDDLKKRGTHLIEFTTDFGTDDRYEVTMADNMIRLQPAKGQRGEPYVRPAWPGTTRNPLQHWFYPAGTVILYVQNPPDGQNLDEEIERAARARGLVPLSDLWPDFKPPLTRQGQHYYVDKKDKVLKNVAAGEATKIGTVAVNKTVYGLQGDETETGEIPVYGRAPTSDE